MQRLNAATVLVAGLGAVGSYAVEALVRSGIGGLVLIDCDTIQPSNLNRQLYALHSTIGTHKVDLARARALDIHPDCRVHAESLFIDQTTANGLIETHTPDIVIDAIDSLGPKTQLLEVCVKRDVPTLSSMGAATRTRSDLIRVNDISKTTFCPLARFVRKWLGRRGITTGVRCVYSVEPRNADALEPGKPSDVAVRRGRERHVMGSLATIPGIFGLTLANETIRFLVSGSFALNAPQTTATETTVAPPLS